MGKTAKQIRLIGRQSKTNNIYLILEVGILLKMTFSIANTEEKPAIYNLL